MFQFNAAAVLHDEDTLVQRAVREHRYVRLGTCHRTDVAARIVDNVLETEPGWRAHHHAQALYTGDVLGRQGEVRGGGAARFDVILHRLSKAGEQELETVAVAL